MFRYMYKKLTNWLADRREAKVAERYYRAEYAQAREAWEQAAEAERQELLQWRAKLKKAGIFYDA